MAGNPRPERGWHNDWSPGPVLALTPMNHRFVTTLMACTLMLPGLLWGSDTNAATAPSTRPTTQEALSPNIRPLAPPEARPVQQICKAIVVSIDGLRPDLLLLAHAPNIRELIARGAYSMWARTTPNAITLPSHVSMMTGVNPRRHEIEWNRDLPLNMPVYPRVPTLFEAAKRHGYTTALAAGKEKFDLFDRPGVLDWKHIPHTITSETASVIGPAVQIIGAHHPDVMLVHLPSVDNVGHLIGWATPRQMQAIEEADAAVRQIVKAMDEAQMTGSTLLIVTSDHGGAGRTHGPDDFRARYIPWIAVGPRIRHIDLTTYPKLVINTEDTFATVCWMLGIPPTLPDLDGQPVKLILEQTAAELLHPAPAKPPPSW